MEATHWSELPFLYLYYKPILVYLSIMISQCFSCIFLFIYIQSYWNAPEHVAVADEKNLDVILKLLIHALFLHIFLIVKVYYNFMLWTSLPTSISGKYFFSILLFTACLLFCIMKAGSSYCWVTSISERRWYNMSTYETLSLMIAFGVLVVMIIGTKK